LQDSLNKLGLCALSLIMKRTAILVFQILCIQILSFGQSSNLKRGWEHFSKNEYDNAKDKFDKASSSEPEAFLGLALVAQMEGDEENAFLNFEKFYNVHPSPVPYLDALWNTEMVSFFGSKADSKKMAFFKKIIKDKELPGRTVAKIHELFADKFTDDSKFSKAEEEYAQMGSISVWSSVGEFENISGSGFEKEYPPISKPKKSEKFTNRNGVGVEWFNIKTIRRDQWVDLEYYFYGSSSIVYSQTFVESASAQPVQLRFGVSGSIKVWLNDILILSEEEERNNDFDSYIISTKLKSGNNRILVQTGESEADAHNFMLRITDDNGFPIPDLKFKSEYQGYKKDDNLKFEFVQNPTEKYFEGLVKKNPDYLVYQLMLAQSYLNADKKFETRKALAVAEKLAPTSTYVKIKQFEIFSKEKNRTGLAKLLEWFKSNDITNPISQNLRFNEAMENENYERADSILVLMKENETEEETYLENSITYLSSRKMVEDMVKVVDEAYKKYPTNYTFASLKASIAEELNQDNMAAIKIYNKYLDKHYSKGVKEKVANLYFSSNNAAAGLREIEEIVKNDPASLAYHNMLSQIYTAMRDYKAAITSIDKCIEIAPYIGGYYQSKAKCYEEMKEDDNAIENYELALKYSPYNFEVRKKLRKLNGENEDIFTNFEKVDVYKEVANTKASSYPDENSAIVLLDNQKVVYSSCASEEKVTIVAKIFTAAGIDEWKEYGIPSASNQTVTVEKTEVIKANGSKLEAERSGGDVVFTNLEVGDAIHICYKIDHYSIGRLNQHFWDYHYFSLRFPVKSNRYALLVDPSVKFKHKFTNGGFEPVVSKKKKMDMYLWKKDNGENFKSEKYMPEIVDFGEVLQISTLPDWNFISQWYANLANTKSKPNYDVKEVVAELFTNKQELSDFQKAKMIHEYIVKNIRYSSVSFRQSGLIPQKASNVLNTKIGDCKDVSTLFVSMCKEAGIDSAGLVLVDTRDNGKKAMILPSIDFNHCIATFSDKRNKYYVELTSDKLGFTSHGDVLNSAFVLPVSSTLNYSTNEPFYLKSPQKVPDLNIRETVLTFNNTKEIVVDVKSFKTGNQAVDTRYSYADITEAERKKKLADAVTYGSNTVKLNNYSFEKLDAVSDTLQYKYNYTITNGVNQMVGLNIFSIPWAGRFVNTDVVVEEERKTPFLIWYIFDYDKIKETTTITLPTGKALAEPMKNVTFDNEWFTYNISYKVTGNKIIATREITTKKDVVEAKDYLAFKSLYEKMVESDTKQIAFK